MKRFLTTLLTVALAGSLVACGPAAPKVSGTLVVGTPKMNGDFINGFGNSSYDNQVRKLLGFTSGLTTYAVTDGGEFVENDPVVKKVESALDAEGNKTYTFTLEKGLKWSDDNDIKAEDFIFSLLWAASPEWLAAGATDTTGDTFIGYADYHEGKTTTFKGAQLIDDLTFSLTIAKEELPYFYEFSMVAMGPSPMHVWAPEAKIESSADGVKLTGVDLAAATQAVATGFRYTPTVSAGPFKFVSFENDAVTVEVNPNYPGDYRGEKPKLEKVIVKYINQTIDVDLVISGDVDLVAGVIEGAKIEKILNSDQADATYYARNGYGMLAMHNDFGPTANPAVRKAIAYLVDRNAFVTGILGGYGSLVNGQYGLSQWMYIVNKEAIENDLENFVYNPAKANELLDSTEWKFEADGVTPFDPAKASADYHRYNSKKEVLQINHFGTIDNAVTDLVQIEVPKGFATAGIKFTTETGDFNKLLQNYYYGFELGAERKYHIFNLATGFTAVFDPYYASLSCDFIGTWSNSTQTCDQELEGYIKEMRELDPSDKETYAAVWLKYQKRWNEIVPVLPLYSNQYYDVFNKRVSGVKTTPVADWADMIEYISVKE